MDTKKEIKKDVNYYLNLPWTYTVETTFEQGQFFYIVHVNELPSLATDAPSLGEAMQTIKEVMAAVFELYLRDGETIPEPKPENYTKKRRIIYKASGNRDEDLLAREAKKRNLSVSKFFDTLVDRTFQK